MKIKNTKNFKKLQKAILEKSVSKTWNKAKEEWTEVGREQTFDNSNHCLCGHPIHELCYIENIKNGSQEIVGNCCINYFLETDSNRFFQGLKRIRTDSKNSANEALIIWAHKENILNEWEYGFYLSIWRKRKLTERQWNIKISLNKKILKAYSGVGRYLDKQEYLLGVVQ